MLGKFKAAIEVYNEANRAEREDRDVLFNLGLCYRQLKLYDKAIKCFQEANDISKNEETYQQIGRTYAVQEDFENALATYLDALQFSNDNEGIGVVRRLRRQCIAVILCLMLLWLLLGSTRRIIIIIIIIIT